MNHNFHALTRRCLALPLIALSCSVVQAQNRPTVTKVFDFFEPYPEKVPVGTAVAFRLKTATTPSFVHALQVRVFSLRDGESVPTPINPDHPASDCDIYVSVVRHLEFGADRQLRLETVDHRWLTLTYAHNAVKEGRYYLVFEQAGPQSAQFRIRAEDAKRYFESGFALTVYGGGTVSLEDVEREYRKRREALDLVYLEIDDRTKAVPCYRYQKLTAEGDAPLELASAQLEPCTNDAMDSAN